MGLLRAGDDPPVPRTQHGCPPRQHLPRGLVREVAAAALDHVAQLCLEICRGEDEAAHGDRGVFPELVELKQRDPVQSELGSGEEVPLLGEDTQHLGKLVQGHRVHVLGGQQPVHKLHIENMVFPVRKQTLFIVMLGCYVFTINLYLEKCNP